MHRITTAIGGLKTKPPPWLRGVATMALIVFAVITLVFWVWAKPPPWLAATVLGLQIVAMVVMGVILTGKFPVLRFQIRRIQKKPEDLTQAQWDDVRAKRRKRRRMVLRLISTVGIVLTLVLLWEQGTWWGKILSVLIAYLYYWVLYSRSKVTSPYPGSTPERVGADIGEPISVSPFWLGWFSIALRWVKGEFPAKPIGENRPRFLFRKIWASLPPPAGLVLFLAAKNPWAELPWGFYLLGGAVGISFWLWWAGLGWPSIKYTLGAGEDPDVIISRPKLHLEGMEIETLYNKASLFNMGTTETRRGGAVHWNPAVMAVTVGGELKEPMNLPWCLEWVMRKVLAAGATAKKRR